MVFSLKRVVFSVVRSQLKVTPTRKIHLSFADILSKTKTLPKGMPTCAIFTVAGRFSPFNNLTVVRFSLMKNVINTLRNALSDNLPVECQAVKDLNCADIIVSLTSYPPRFSSLHKVIKSLLQQSLRPARICLWIAEKDMSLLPPKVCAFERSGLDIQPVPDFQSYSKIIHCYQQYTGSVIVTCDDDMLYPSEWLRLLYAHHLQSPSSVICHRARYMTFRPNGEINPYWLWPNLEREAESLLVYPIGAGGVLYPANCFHDDLVRDDIFMKICQHGDDIWLKAMTLLNAVQCKKIHYYSRYFRHVKNSQHVALKQINTESRNDINVRQVFRKYDILQRLRNSPEFQGESKMSDICM